MFKPFLSPALLSIVAVSVCALALPQEVMAQRGGNAGGNRNVNANANVNRNTNVNVNKNVNVNVDGGYNNYNNNYHPVARAAAVTTAVVVTAAVVGSVVAANQLPTNCVQVNNGGMIYMQCGSTWYQPQYQGSNVTYIVVNHP